MPLPALIRSATGEQDDTAATYGKALRADGLDPVALCAVLCAKTRQLEARLAALEGTPA